MPQCPRAPRHSYSADSSRLFVVTCDHCGASRSYRRRNHQVSKYLKYRRIKRRELGLLNVAAPLDAASASLLTTVSSQCGLVSSASGVPHVTYAEGLRPEAMFRTGLGSAVEALRESLRVEPTLTVVKVHSVPRRDGTTDLIIADVAVERGVSDAAGRVCATSSPKEGAAAASRNHGGKAAWCALPQFPYHVALGACAKKNVSGALAAASKRMLGMQLRIDAGRMKVLAPSERRGETEQQHGSLPKMILQRGRAPPTSAADSTEEGNSSSDGLTSSTENDSSDEQQVLPEGGNKTKERTATEDDDALSEDSTLPLTSPEDSDGDDDFGLAVDLSFLDEAIPSPVMVRRPKSARSNAARARAAAAGEEEVGPPSWQDPTPGHGPVSTAPFVTTVPAPPPPPPRREPAQNKTHQQAQQHNNAAAVHKEHQHKRGTSKGGNFLTRCIPGRRSQVAPIPPGNNTTAGAPGAMHPQVSSEAAAARGPPPPPPPPPKAQHPPQVQQPWTAAVPTSDFDQPLYYHHNGMSMAGGMPPPPPQQQQQHHQAQPPSQAYAPPLAMFNRQPMFDAEQLYQLYNQPVAPQPYPVENGYVTWVRVTPLTYEPLFVPNTNGNGNGAGYNTEVSHTH